MQTAKQKMSDAAASAKERVDVLKAKAEGKADKTMASSKEDKEVAKEQKKAKEAEAKVRKHEEKADNATGHLQAKHQGQFGQQDLHGAGAAPATQGNQYPAGGATQIPPEEAAAQYEQAAPGTNPAAPTQ
ncbi:hypothetical protein F511_00521 [Dorcoceras hygrometricum]|uniref:Late embryogenesis abundant protein 2 n=1 Tax=Dorcoceras hygrometricum TaxID=472368 RepID=B4YSF1_9LAMI|nr:late embryogenesis abundant protein 2 [Dorcoceras hygrometricum]KZV31717.1 hypothetical protein F511_00521 [Dorcoceras hygrometricum]